MVRSLYHSNVVNVHRAILHDDTMFLSPEEFRPDRFLDNPALPDPADLGAFGFGRR